MPKTNCHFCGYAETPIHFVVHRFLEPDQEMPDIWVSPLDEQRVQRSDLKILKDHTPPFSYSWETGKSVFLLAWKTR
jgi:hypothetical protein